VTNAIGTYLQMNLISLDKKLNEKNQMAESIKIIATEDKVIFYFLLEAIGIGELHEKVHAGGL
jgi:hypothetical protein